MPNGYASSRASSLWALLSPERILADRAAYPRAKLGLLHMGYAAYDVLDTYLGMRRSLGRNRPVRFK